MGLEIYCHKEAALSHLYLALNDRQTREELVDSILRQPDVALEDLAQENMTLKWQSGLVSNYDYLTYLNSLADRSINDLTQYPVFPWVLADYISTHLDLSNPASFRDLSKPIGALNPDRLDKLLTRYREMPEPRFLYGSHYSSPGYVLFYLARVAPEYMLCLHNGRFDQPDRMFNSVTDAWNNCLTSFSNFMELIPEFYGSSTDFLCNKERINFGNRQDGRPVGDIEVPPWAEDATDFIKKMREALECDYVSQHLNEWIDLIFGYKQHGTEAELAYNVFYYLTYEGAVDMDSIDEPDERAALEAQIAEFGQTPKQLFISPHPRRKGLPDTCVTTPSPSECGMSTTDGKSESGVATNQSAVVCDSQMAAWRTVNAPELVLVHQLHKDVVTAVKWNTDGSSLLSVSKDTFLKIYSVEDERQLRSVSLSNMALSSLVTTADSKTVIMGCWDNSIYIYSLEFGHTLQTLDAHDDAVSALCLHDNLLVSSSWDSTVKVRTSKT
ncbi:Protein FAN [Lamellibrachia satsuma]|nr:Protein FAN [Lamellibrachia satsuma]